MSEGVQTLFCGGRRGGRTEAMRVARAIRLAKEEWALQQVRELLPRLTNAQRVQLLKDYCPTCGAAHGQTACWCV